MAIDRPYTLITGASSGIGLAIAGVAAREHHNLVLVARRGERLEELKKELSADDIDIVTVPFDLARPGAAEELVAILNEREVVVDRLVNNAGFGSLGLFHEQSLERSRSMIQLNVVTLVELTRLLLPGMLERESGKILQVASTAGFAPGPLQAVYFSTKAFVVSFSQAINEEVRGTGVTSTALCPGPVRTEFIETAGLENSTLAQRAATPEAVATVGWKGMERGKLVVSENRFLLFLLRFINPLMPRRTTLKATRKIQESH